MDAAAAAISRIIDPLVLDLTGEGLKLTSLNPWSPSFDLAGNGFARKTGWIGSGTGLLGIDRNGDGKFTTLSELFGTAGGAKDGFAALVTLDSNGDGKIDASDAAFGSLRVWVDANGDAVTGQGEARTLSDLGIVSINLTSQASQQTLAGNSVLAIGSYTLADGTTREIADVGFANSATYTTATTTVLVSAEVAALPELHGYGTVAGLQQAMAGNPALKALVQAFAALPATTPYADVMAAVQAIMFEWAGVTALDPNSRGGQFDARKLAFMERYLGDSPTFAGGGSNPGSLSGAILSQAWADLQSGIAARLVLQGPLSAYQGDFTFNVTLDAIVPAQEFKAALADLSQRLGPLTAASLDSWRQAALVIDGVRQDLHLDSMAFTQLVASATTPNIAALVSAAGNSLTVQIDAAGKLTFSDPNWAASVDRRTTNLALATPARTFAALTGDSKEVGVSGVDTFLFNAGGGRLEIDEAVRARLAAQTSVLKLGAGLNAADFYRTNSANPADIVLVNRVTGDLITLDGEGTDTARGVGSVQFADGTVWTRQQLLALAITGTTGADRLYGTGSADTFDAKGAPAGVQDYVRGGGGGDTFVYNAGYGQLEVDETEYSSAPNNVLKLGTGITAAQVTVTGDSSGNIVLTDGTSGDQIKLDYELGGQYYGVQQVQFADGTTWSKAQLIGLATTGTTGADRLYGTGSADTFDAKGAPAGSQDYVRGGGGGDTFIYNAGYGQLEVDETEYSSAPNNVLKLGTGITAAQVTVTGDSSGNIVLTDGTSGDQIKLDYELGGQYYGVQQVQFADGTTWSKAQLIGLATTGTTGADRLYGTGSADTFDAKGAPAGSQDYVRGSGGGDTFIYNAGYGQLEVDETEYSSAPNNVLKLGTGITAAQVTVTGDSSGNIVLTDGTSGDQIKLDYELNGQYYGVQQVQFADGTTWSKAQLIGLATTGTAGADKLYGSSGADTLDGKGITSYARGGGGGDIFVFNAGYGHLEVDETEYSSAPNNVLKLGTGITAAQVTVTGDSSGHVTLTNGTAGDQIKLDYELSGQYYGVQQVQFADGTTWSKSQLVMMATTGTVRTDALYGTSGSDVFDARGAPVGGQDYVRGSGGGDTFVFNAGYGHLEVDETEYSSAPNNVLRFGTGITADQVTVTGDSSGNIVLTDGTSGDQIKLDYELNGQYYGVQQVQFVDGTTWSKPQLVTMATTGTPGTDRLYGSSGTDVFDGLGGTDYERGSGGGDTFIYNAGYGQLEVDETEYSSAPNNVLKLGTGITAAQVTVTGDSSGNIVLTDGTSGDQIKLDYELGGQYYGVQQVQFADGTTWSKAQLIGLATTGTTGADRLYGTGSADTFDAKGAPAGSQDYVRGGGGGDTFIYNAGYGQLEVDETEYSSAPNNVLKLGTGITAAQVTVTGDSSGNIVLTDGTSGDQIKLDYELGGQYYGVQQVQFADGTTWSKAQLIGLASLGTAGSDIINGTSSNDMLDGRGGTDTINGGGGYDTYFIRQGYGATTIDNSTPSGTTAQGEVDYGPGITEQNLWFSRSGNDLVASVLGSADAVDIKGWFGTNPSAQVAEFKAFNGLKLDGQVGQLTTAMAAYAGSNPGFDPATAAAMPTDPTLRSALAGTWHS